MTEQTPDAEEAQTETPQGETLNAPPADTGPDLLSMTKAQLLDYAEENGVEGVSSRMNKADIIEKIESS